MNGKMFSLLMYFVFKMYACSAGPTSDVKVTNGITTMKFPAVVQINPGGASCTATFIQPQVLLTAAHCVNHGDAPVVIPQLLRASSDVVMHPDYGQKDHTDLALVFFSEPLAQDTMALQFEMPALNEPVTLVGYGNNRYVQGLKSIGSMNIKRIGSNKVLAANDHAIQIRGTSQAYPDNTSSPTGEQASGASGDSGGPLLNSRDEIVGVASYVGQSGHQMISTTYTSLKLMAPFIEKAIATRAQPQKAPFQKACESQLQSKTVQFLFERFSPDLSCSTLYGQLASSNQLMLSGSPVGENIFDAAILQDLTWLHRLLIHHLNITNLEALASLPYLMELDIQQSGIVDFSPLKKSWSLMKVTIEETKDVLDLEPLRSIPNVHHVMVNGKPVGPLLPFRDQVFAGSWEKDCEVVHESPFRLFQKYTMDYIQEKGELQIKSVLYQDESCTSKPALKLHHKVHVGGLMPTDIPDIFDLDLETHEGPSLMVYDDTALDDEMRSLLKGACPYEVGVLTAGCDSIRLFSDYTRIRVSHDALYFALTDMNHKYDGSSPKLRPRAIDLKPYKKKLSQ